MQDRALLDRVGLGLDEDVDSRQNVAVGGGRARDRKRALGPLQGEGQPAGAAGDLDRLAGDVGRQVDGVAVGLF